MTDILYPEGTISQGTGSNPLNPFNWFQEKPDTSAYTTSGPDSNQMWNTGWNSGFNSGGAANTNSDVNFGSGYTAGWQEYQNRNKTSGYTGSSPTGGTIVNTDVGSNIPSGPSAEDIYRQQQEGLINSGYNSYFDNLNAQLGGLPGQQTIQNNSIDNSYNSGVSDLNLQQTQGDQTFQGQRGEITGNQNKNLKSIDENLRNMFMAGNVYLGSRGAGDSSAANQYSYALTKQGNQARGDQMTAATKALSEVQGRETNLKNIVTNEMTKLKTNADNEKNKVALWFQDAQQQVKTAIANGELNKSTDLRQLSTSIYDQAVARLNKLQTDTTDRQNSLITWAENNSKSIGELKTNIQTVLAQVPQLMGGSQINGNPSVDAQGNYSLQGFGSGQTAQKKDIFGNIIS